MEEEPKRKVSSQFSVHSTERKASDLIEDEQSRSFTDLLDRFSEKEEKQEEKEEKEENSTSTVWMNDDGLGLSEEEEDEESWGSEVSSTTPSNEDSEGLRRRGHAQPRMKKADEDEESMNERDRKRSSRALNATLARNMKMANKMNEISGSKMGASVGLDMLRFRILVALSIIGIVLVALLAVTVWAMTRNTRDPFIAVQIASLKLPQTTEKRRALAMTLLKGRIGRSRFKLHSLVEDTIKEVLAHIEDEERVSLAVADAVSLFLEQSENVGANAGKMVLGTFALAVAFLLGTYFLVFRKNLDTLDKAQRDAQEAIEKKILQTVKEIELVDTVSEVAAVLMETTSFHSLMKTLLSRAADLVGAEGGTLFLYNPENDSLKATQYVSSRLHQFRGTDGKKAGVEILLDSNVPSFLGATLMSMSPCRLKDASQNIGFVGDFKGAFSNRHTAAIFRKARSVMAVPLFKGGNEPIGVLLMINKINANGKRAEFTDEDEQVVAGIFCTLAEHAIMRAIEHSRVRSMKERIEHILEAINAIVLNFGPDKRLLATNKAEEMSHLFAIGKDSNVHELTYEDIFPDEELISDLDDSLFSGTVIDSAQKKLQLKTGAQAFIKYSSAPLKSRAGGIAVVVEDVSAEMRVKNALTRYMSPQLAEKVVADGGGVLGGNMVDATVVFADIRNFTSLSEVLEPQELVATLNEHFSGMIDACNKHHGVLDKFIGDCIMCVFGIPYPSKDDASNACRAMLEMLDFLDKLSDQRRQKKLRTLNIGIGCNTGIMLAGNLGNHDRMDYSVIGDNVNLASRIEGTTKQYGVRCLITEYTKQQIEQDLFLIREIDKVVVVGKAEPVVIYELLGLASCPKAKELVSLITDYEIGLKSYRDGKWVDAAAIWDRLAKQGDKCSEIMRKKIGNQTAPPANFNPVSELLSK